MEIDEDLHSRQLAVYGKDSMKRMAQSNILISGLSGLGAEIAKNVILAGVRAVALHDTENAQLSDLGSQFYLNEADIGKNRAEACLNHFQSLNRAVKVSVLKHVLTEKDLAAFNVVVFTNHGMDDLIRFDAFCRTQQPPIAFIKCETRGVCGNVFCDFGAGFVTTDVNGEEPASGIVASISNEDPALVTCVEDEHIDFEEGDYVVFSEVQGMVELNDGRPRKIQSVNKRQKSFLLELGSGNYSQYVRGGVVAAVKQPKTLDFLSLKDAIEKPGELLLYDFAKMTMPGLLHVAFLALDEFKKAKGRFPESYHQEDAAALVAIAHDINSRLPENVRLESLDDGVLSKFSFTAAADLSPLAAVIGAMAAQEVLKAVSGKFHPLFQWFFFDAFESLPQQVSAADTQPRGTRYDAQAACIGHTMQTKIGNLKLFLVGAGALGCEFLKNFGMMGVACGKDGKLTVTDDDTIERSNLSRQFLFRDEHIGQSKSAAATGAALAMNPNLRITAMQNRVSGETEEIFNDSFWESLDLVTNALDNVHARLYVDSRCVYFQRPLLESGTLGTKCNTQMVLPLMTENYGASRDPPEKQAPMCTLHSFPHNIDHCLTWARSEFEGLFEKTPTEVNGWLSKPDYDKNVSQQNPAEARECLTKVVGCLVQERCNNFSDCIRWARTRFEDYNVNRILQLVFSFPEDATTSSGGLFWSAPKRFPRAVRFNPADPVHQDFIMAAANLRAENFGLEKPAWNRDKAKIAAEAAAVQVPEFVPKKGVKITTDEKENKEEGGAAAAASSSVAMPEDDTEQIRKLMESLSMVRPSLGSDFSMHAVAFEKDNDTNFHMDFIAAAANLRARVYSIPEVDKLKAKLIAGRIIPAIATATALAAGLVCLELLKVVDAKPIEAFRNAFVNLALPLVTMAEPIPAKKAKFGQQEWSIWDRWVVPGEPTLQEMSDWLKTTRGIKMSIVSYNSALIYAQWMPAHKNRLNKKLTDLVKEVAKCEFPRGKNFIDFVVACEDDEGNDVDIPLISIRLPH